MLSKEMFVECINFMRDRSDAMDRVNKLFTEEFEDSIFYPYFKYEAMMGRVLKDAMRDEKNDWISWFLYEVDYGRDAKPDSVTEADGTPIDLTTPEKLYDFLISEYFTDEEVVED